MGFAVHMEPGGYVPSVVLLASTWTPSWDDDLTSRVLLYLRSVATVVILLVNHPLVVTNKI